MSLPLASVEPHPAVVDADRIHAWLDETARREVWFVDPSHHVPKAADALNVGVLSHFGYQFSMIALGHLALYHQVNRDPDCPAIADRIHVYEPLFGANGRLRPGLALTAPLSTFERRIPLKALDLICVSLTNADEITTVLSLLELGQVPLRRADRLDGPLILAGGPGCGNPEPFADYFDLFCVGDGCTLTTRILRAMHGLRSRQRPTAEEVHQVLGAIDGLYVPSLYTVSYAGQRVTAIIRGDAVPARVQPAVDPASPPLQASLVSDGETAVIVPTHGCKHRCGYCQISETAFREFSIEPLLNQVDRYLADGISTLIINSATLTQHSDVVPLLTGVADRIEGCGREVSVYMGSVRFDEVSSDLLARIGRLSGFSHTYLLYTNGKSRKFMALAPEHGSRDLMRRVHRPIDPWRVLDTVDLAAQAGVHNFVLYFIVGFESETVEDRAQITALTTAILDRVAPFGGRLILKINPLMPTPGTACQRMPMPSIATYHKYLDEITNGLIAQVGQRRYDEQVEIVALPDRRLLVETIISRADRRLGPLVSRLAACRASGEEPDEETLHGWLADLGFSLEHLASARADDEILPWQVVDRTLPSAERQVLITVRNLVP